MNYIDNNYQRGQVLLIVVLVLVTIVTVGLSVVTRTITNTRVTQEEENSERAFSAAEAGIEEALTTKIDSSGNFINNNTSYQTSLTPIAGSALLLNNGVPIFKNDGIDVSLIGVIPSGSPSPSPTPTPQSCASLPSNIAGWWRGENNGTDTINGNTATLQLGAGYTTGKVGSSFLFDGVDSKALIPYDADINLNSQFALEGWIRPTPVAGGLQGAYFRNQSLSGSPATRTDSTVNFNWGSGAPISGFPADNFSVRWTGYVVPQYSQTYTFYTMSDDGVRLWVDGQLIINNWTIHGATENSGSITLTAGKPYVIRMELFESTNFSVAQLSWSSPSTPKQIIPQPRLLPDGFYKTLVAKGNYPSSRNYVLSMDAGGTLHLSFIDQAGVNTYVNAPTALTIGSWQHVAATMRWGTGGSMKIYVNGVLQASRSISTLPRADSSPLVIGNENSQNWPFSGAIDELSIYNRELSTSEIQNIYNVQAAGKCVSSPSPTPTPSPPPVSPSGWSGDLTIYWGASGDVCSASELSNTMAALDITVNSGTEDNPVSTRYPVDPCSARASANNFEYVPPGGDVISGKAFRYKKTITVTSGVSIRVVPLYAGTVVGIKGCNSAGINCRNLPSQGVLIESLGVSENAQRKVVRFQPYPRLPAELFPFVLFVPK